MPTASQTRSPQSRGRAGTDARTAVIEMLKEDHKRARKAFRDFDRLDPEEDPEACAEIVSQCCAELSVHATLEEELLYPAAREVVAEEGLVDEAEVEHTTAKELISQLQQMQPGDNKFAAKFTVLGEYIKHHVKEEEGEMFPQLERAKLDWPALHAEMLARREALMIELMPAEEVGGETSASGGDSSDAADHDSNEDEDDDKGVTAARAAPARKRAGSSRNGSAQARKT